jgi:uridine kinase
MVGDATTDIEAGRRAGLRTILVRTGYAGTDKKYAVRPDYVVPNLCEAVEWILVKHAEVTRRLSSIAVDATTKCRLMLVGGLARSGKSFTAQVLSEILVALGKRSHVISLDGWLKPRELRAEGCGVLERYDLNSASEIIELVAKSRKRLKIVEPLYDRLSRSTGPQHVEHSVGPEDIIIVEGVPALLMDKLAQLPRVMKIFVQVSETIREERFKLDYEWRRTPSATLRSVVDSRGIDEVPVVQHSRFNADIIVTSDDAETIVV